MMILPDRLARLDTLTLDKGTHNTFEDGHCAMETIAWLVDEEHTDEPSCVSPILGAFVRRWNDDLDDEGRQRLKPLLPLMVGTAGDGHDELRGWLCADWLVRVHTPAWLELAGIRDAAAALRGLPPLRDPASLDAARPMIDAAWAAAVVAAGDAAQDAALVAARAAAGDAAWVAAWDAAGVGVGVAAWDAAAAAARAAAVVAAGDAAGDALKPTTESLQSSALELLKRLIDPNRDDRGAA